MTSTALASATQATRTVSACGDPWWASSHLSRSPAIRFIRATGGCSGRGLGASPLTLRHAAATLLVFSTCRSSVASSNLSASCSWSMCSTTLRPRSRVRGALPSRRAARDITSSLAKSVGSTTAGAGSGGGVGGRGGAPDRSSSGSSSGSGAGGGAGIAAASTRRASMVLRC